MLTWLVLAGTGLMADVAPPEAVDPPSLEPHQAEVCSHARSAMKRMLGPPAGLMGLDGFAGGAPITDVLHYNLDLEIVPVGTTLIGVNIITVKSLVNGLSTFDFALRQEFAISSVQVNSVAAAWVRLNADLVRVTLNPVINADEQFDLRIAYNGVPLSGGFGSINFMTQSGQPLIFTLSEPFYSHTWWPVKDDNTDKATGELAFTVPNTLKVASNGIRQGIDVVGGSKLKYRWATDYPTSPYLFCFSATNYNEYTDSWVHPDAPGGSMLMQFFIYPASDTNPANLNAWKATKQMLTTFRPIFGVYPFADEKYGIYQFGFGGGMEHQTMTGQGTFSESVTAHELGHQWWGDMVTCADWHHIWLNEGFATYSEALWLEFKPGSTGTPALLAAMAARRPTTMNTTVYRANISSAGVIFNNDAVYRKGGWVVHMLRHVVGDANFFEILDQYRTTHEYGTAVTEDLQAVAEAVYGQSLETFFEPWIYSTGAPTYQTAWRTMSAGGSQYVELLFKQVQSAAWPTYDMPVDIRCTIGGSPVTKKIRNDQRSEHLLFEVSAAPTAIAIDPDNYVLRATNQTTTFVEGPPKIVKVTPLPGSDNAFGDVGSVQVVFHRNVNAVAGDFAITGQSTGSVPFAYSYDAPTMTATLTPSSSLAADTYTVTVQPTVTNAVGGAALDGEISNSSDPASLPSGEGLPGGAAAFVFAVDVQPCGPDITGNGTVDLADLLAVIAAWGATGSNPADVNGDNVVNLADLLAVIAAWGVCA